MKTDSTTRRELIQRSATALAVGAVAVPASVVSTVASAAEPDPIFALIEAHKAAMAEHLRLLEIKSVIPNTEEACADAEEESDQAFDLVDEAQTALLTTSPTTVAGAAAVLAYVASFWIEGNDSCDRGLSVYERLTHDGIPSIGDGFLPMIAAALQRLTAV